ncbi:hypothetical protein [Burkholderia sp. Ac-20379]|uniref:hypothetical protein n=1 Tax=Burkholderia sp. Ac-20379 TaxID=2703900 RepID=UPI00197EA2CD|nr:hypothetical protein [Burkholderia sp. Ac-20379]MBN3726224.1 hypothetical protein [Burkholderia sp. Ac-20379]
MADAKARAHHETHHDAGVRRAINGKVTEMDGSPDWFVSFKLALHLVMLCIGAATAWAALLDRFG